MKPEQYFRWLARRIEDAAETEFLETIEATRRRMRQRIPSNRKRTRQALRWRVRDNGTVQRGELALVFSQRYRTSGTETQAIFRRAWDRTKNTITPDLRKRLIIKLKE